MLHTETLACLVTTEGIVSQQWYWVVLWVVLDVSFNGCLKMRE